ncbi:cell division protein FtsW [Halobacteroides halobius DSM 5150]|uniref:Probable peptidoglycan glycosyltransferase FtsW n=1 Tax=Halobacteroides halobius (strain ATCC 35273 / DSM 5150 / MD-1) TaxID=748449 RepID=L0KAZ0_HALHC|nr:putative lipid II flippase FtsW [Halobacteroides halobius]AGB41705.1 cell division protein FtsW [Halobacteroides halobius DSM 5150]
MKRPPDYIIFLVIILLMGLSVTMVFSATSISAYVNYEDSFYFLKRQLTWVALGLAVMILVANVNYHRYLNWANYILLGSIILLILVLIVGNEVNGSKRWLDMGIRIQPSTIAKIAIIFYMARYIHLAQDRIKKFWTGLMPALAILGLFFVLILLEPDLGTAGTIAMTVVVMLVAAGARVLHLGGLAASGLPLFVFALMGESYRRRRIFAFLDPWADPQGTGFHIIQSLYALGSGGLFGVGLGHSKQKFFYLPEPGTDFIFAVLGEELGFVGSSVVLFLYLLLALRGLQIAMRAPDLFGSMLAVGITTWIVLQAIINIGVVTGSMPVTGITLPFISYGGTSLIVMSASIGVLLNISRFCKK